MHGLSVEVRLNDWKRICKKHKITSKLKKFKVKKQRCSICNRAIAKGNIICEPCMKADDERISMLRRNLINGRIDRKV
jgi:hypothetical protein